MQREVDLHLFLSPSLSSNGVGCPRFSFSFILFLRIVSRISSFLSPISVFFSSHSLLLYFVVLFACLFVWIFFPNLFIFFHSFLAAIRFVHSEALGGSSDCQCLLTIVCSDA